MTLAAPLDAWLGEIARSSLETTGDRVAIARGNLWSFAPRRDVRAELSIDDVAAFLQAVGDLWAARVPGPFVFYAWHDEQAAGALRFSLVPGHVAEPLPFGCSVDKTTEPSAICRSFLASNDVLPLDALRGVVGDDEATPDGPAFTLSVFVRQL